MLSFPVGSVVVWDRRANCSDVKNSSLDGSRAETLRTEELLP